jgi:neutral ceramidase
MDLKWKAGAAKSKILTYPENQVMLGYAHPSRNYVRGVKTPLFVRCLTLELENNYLILINYETGFITEALRRELSQRIINTFSSLNLSFDNILISAQHTHSAPSGYDEYFYYSIPGKGFYPEYLEVLVKHGLEAVSKALESHDERDLYWIRKDLPADLAIARNRAMKSWRRNTNVDKSKNEVSAFDRRMGILGFYNEKQEPTAFWNWFACHATCLGNKNTLISSDNKGYASIHHENKFNNQFVSVFAQGSAGDVSPNFIHSKKKRHGFLNDFDHVRDNGQKHLDAFEHIISLEKTAIIPSVLKSEAFFVDMSAGDERRQSFVGVSMLRGAKEGRGMPDFFLLLYLFYGEFRTSA